MAETRETDTQGDSEIATADKEPRSLKVATKGIRTGQDFALLMSTLMSDIIDGRVTPSVGNATCNAGGKLLKVVEMQYKYGTQAGNSGKRTLTLALEDPTDAPV